MRINRLRWCSPSADRTRRSRRRRPIRRQRCRRLKKWQRSARCRQPTCLSLREYTLAHIHVSYRKARTNTEQWPEPLIRRWPAFIPSRLLLETQFPPFLIHVTGHILVHSNLPFYKMGSILCQRFRPFWVIFQDYIIEYFVLWLQKFQIAQMNEETLYFIVKKKPKPFSVLDLGIFVKRFKCYNPFFSGGHF